MSLRKIDGELDLERIGDYDPLSWMDEDVMKRHIAKVFSEVSASGADMDRIAMAFLGPEMHGRRERLLLRLRNPRPMTQDRLELYPKDQKQVRHRDSVRGVDSVVIGRMKIRKNR